MTTEQKLREALRKVLSLSKRRIEKLTWEDREIILAADNAMRLESTSKYSTFALQSLINMVSMAYQCQKNDGVAIEFEPATEDLIKSAREELQALSLPPTQAEPAEQSGFRASVGPTDRSGKYHPDRSALGKEVPVEWLERFAELVAALSAQAVPQDERDKVDAENEKLRHRVHQLERLSNDLSKNEERLTKRCRQLQDLIDAMRTAAPMTQRERNMAAWAHGKKDICMWSHARGIDDAEAHHGIAARAAAKGE